MRSWKQMSGGLKLAIVASAILALSIAGVLANERFGGSNDDAVSARETTDTAKADDAKPTGKPLELGTVAKISGSYRVAVTEINRYEVPSGELIAATVEATYIGKEDGEPWADLNVEFFDSGSRAFGESDCPFGLGDLDPTAQPTLRAGDDATYAVCFDLPDIDIKGGRVLVEEAFSSNGDRASWSTNDAVQTTLPAPSPEPSARRDPASQPRPQTGNDARSNAACANFDEDAFEEYKERGEKVKENFEAYRDAGGDDEDEIDDYEEWEAKYDKRLDALEQLDAAC